MVQDIVSVVSALAAVGAVIYARRAINVSNRLAALVGAAQTCQEYQGRVLELCEKGYTASEIRQLFDLQDVYHRTVTEGDCGRVEEIVKIYGNSQARRGRLRSDG